MGAGTLSSLPNKQTKVYFHKLSRQTPPPQVVYKPWLQSSIKCWSAGAALRAEQGSCEPISELRARSREREIGSQKVRKSGRHFWAIWGNCGPFWVIFGPLWIILGHSRAILGHFGSFWAIFGPFVVATVAKR